MWSPEEKELLISMYPCHTTKELCEILNKSEGQVRGMKERLGLHSKLNAFSEDELESIRTYYSTYTDAIDLNELSSRLNRPKTSIARAAGRMGLTRNDRRPSDDTIQAAKEKNKIFRKSDKYKNEVYPRQKELLGYYAKHNHPRGMAGKHHSDSTKESMSKTHKKIWDSMGEKDRLDLISKIQAGIRSTTPHYSNDNTYSRCKGGYRQDLMRYFRSSWEANFARILNLTGIKWEYEAKRFVFASGDGGVCSYCPDFYLPDYDTWVEIKGWMDDKSKLRIQKLKEEYPSVYKNLVVVDEEMYKCMSVIFSSIVNNWELGKGEKGNGKEKE